MNRRDFQELAKLRRREAQALLVGRFFHGAYYLAGYSLECALKACIAKQTKLHQFPDRKLAQDAHQHDLAKILQLSGLQPEFDNELKTNSAFQLNWAIAKDWSEISRYDWSLTQAQARDLYSACTARSNGLLSWISRRW